MIVIALILTVGCGVWAYQTTLSDSAAQKAKDELGTHAVESQPSQQMQAGPIDLTKLKTNTHSIFGLRLGDSVDKMHKVLGLDYKTSKKIGLNVCDYGDTRVTLDDKNTIRALESTAKDALTDKRIHPGSTASQLIICYGKDCAVKIEGGAPEYQYLFDLDVGVSALLSFTIKNGVVDRASLRLTDADERNKILAGVRTLDENNLPGVPKIDPNAQNDRDDRDDPNERDDQNDRDRSDRNERDEPMSAAASEAAEVLNDFHERITDRNLHAAFNCLSGEFRRETSYAKWADGFKTTVGSSIDDVRLESESSDRIVLSYVLTAVDEPGGERKFNGRATLIKEGNVWKIDDIINRTMH